MENKPAKPARAALDRDAWIKGAIAILAEHGAERLRVEALAKRLGVGRVALSRLLNGATGISPEMALRLSKALGTSPEFWYGMQVNYDLWQAKKKFRGKVRPIIQRESAAA